MNLIYVAGPYTADCEAGYKDNIRKAETAMVELLNRGWSVICPHKNGAWLHVDKRLDSNSFESWLMRDIAIVKVCDAVFFLDGWRDSKGSCTEWGACLALDKQMYFQLDGYPTPYPERVYGDNL